MSIFILWLLFSCLINCNLTAASFYVTFFADSPHGARVSGVVEVKFVKIVPENSVY